jgi:SSS family solute:Na+ symporter
VLTKVSVTAFTGGIFMESLLGLPFWYGAIGLVLLTGVFTVFGGMKGVMTLSKIQTPILIIGSFLVLFLGLSALGGGSIAQGWTNMLDHARQMSEGYGTNHLMHFDTNDPLYDKFPGVWVFIGAAIIGFWYWCTDQHIVQRVLGGKNINEMRKGTILAGYLKILPVFMFLIPGMVAAALAASPESGFVMGATDEAFGSMVKFVLPVGVKGIVTIGFICALVASLAAFFNSCATLYTVDFYKPKHPDANDKKLVWIGRAATWVVVALGLVWIPIMMGLGSLYKYLQEVQSLLAPSIVAVFLLGIFSKRITPKAGETGLIVGFVIGMVRLVCNVFTEKLSAVEGLGGLSWFWETNWLVFEVFLLLFIVLLMIATSFFTSQASEEKLKGITFATQSAAQKAETRASWTWVDVAASLGIAAICAAFYAYFW